MSRWGRGVVVMGFMALVSPASAQDPHQDGTAFDASFRGAMKEGTRNTVAPSPTFRRLYGDWLKLEPEVARAGSRGLAGAWCALHAGDPESALPLFQSAHGQAPPSPMTSADGHPQVGELLALLQLKRDGDAANLASQVPSARAGAIRQSAAGMMGLADRRLRGGDFAGGVLLFEAVTTEFPTHAPSWANLALSQRHVGDLASSESNYRHALQLAPRDAVVWNDFGLMLRAGGRHQEAAAAFEKSFALDVVPGRGPGVTNLVDDVLRDRFAPAAQRATALSRAAQALGERPEATMLRRLTLELLRSGTVNRGPGAPAPTTTRPGGS